MFYFYQSLVKCVQINVFGLVIFYWVNFVNISNENIWSKICPILIFSSYFSPKSSCKIFGFFFKRNHCIYCFDQNWSDLCRLVLWTRSQVMIFRTELMLLSFFSWIYPFNYFVRNWSYIEEGCFYKENDVWLSFK